jgi:ethanolamine kinase
MEKADLVFQRNPESTPITLRMATLHKSDSIRHIALSYDNSDSKNSALKLILALRPEWKDTQETITFVKFTDGITNQLFKAINTLPGLSEKQVDRDAVLLRAYGKGTDVLIDRESMLLRRS